jgi:hypothetical protein
MRHDGGEWIAAPAELGYPAHAVGSEAQDVLPPRLFEPGGFCACCLSEFASSAQEPARCLVLRRAYNLLHDDHGFAGRFSEFRPVEDPGSLASDHCSPLFTCRLIGLRHESSASALALFAGA